MVSSAETITRPVVESTRKSGAEPEPLTKSERPDMVPRTLRSAAAVFVPALPFWMTSVPVMVSPCLET
jgi:hypothetical protein